MRRTKTEPISDILATFLHYNGLETPLAEYRLVKAWPLAVETCVGPELAARIVASTRDLNISSQTLHVSLTSAPLRQHLRMITPQLIEVLNAEAGMLVVTSIALH